MRSSMLEHAARYRSAATLKTPSPSAERCIHDAPSDRVNCATDGLLKEGVEGLGLTDQARSQEFMTGGTYFVTKRTAAL